MAVDNISHAPIRHIATFISSGTFSIPEGVSRVYATVEGARGQSNRGAQPGATHRTNGFVEVIPGKTAQVVIGATAAENATAGTTSFDGAINVFGSNSNAYDGRYNQASQGGAAAASTLTTSLPTGAPAGAIVRVSGNTTASYSPAAGASGVVHIYG